VKETQPERVSPGYRSVTLRSRWYSHRIPVRLDEISAVLFLLAITLAAISLTLGEYHLSVPEVLHAIGIGGDSPRIHRVIVREWRLPVAISAVFFGALLGIGGAIFQSLTRNPLGSPDIIGFDAGSYTAVAITVLVLGSTSYWGTSGCRSHRRRPHYPSGLWAGMVPWRTELPTHHRGYRYVHRPRIAELLPHHPRAGRGCHGCRFWAAGSITRVEWQGLIPVRILGTLIFVAVALLASSLRTMELGDDAATTQGLRVQRTRPLLMVEGVATTALAAAAAGPIDFIALTAPQLARRLTRTAGLSLMTSAAMGSALLTSAYILSLIIAQFYRQIPVGLITVCLGGLYMMWLLVHEARRQYGSPR